MALLKLAHELGNRPLERLTRRFRRVAGSSSRSMARGGGSFGAAVSGSGSAERPVERVDSNTNRTK